MQYLVNKITQEIWKYNPHVDLSFRSSGFAWLSVHGHFFYKGEYATVRVYIYKRPNHIDADFIKAVAHRVINAINNIIITRKDL